MALQFRGYGPDPGEETRRQFQTSLDGIFQAYQQAKQQGLAERDRQGANLLNYGFDPRQVTPQVYGQALQPAPQPQVLPNTAPVANGMVPPRPDLSQPMQPSQFMAGLAQQNAPQNVTLPAAQEPEIVQHVRAYIAKRNKQAELDQAASKAEYAKTLSETDENLAQAEKLRRPAPEGGGVNVVNIRGVDYIQTMGANGAPHYQPIPVREPSQSENAARQYADSATQAHESLKALERSGYEPSKIGNAMESVVPTALQSKEFQSLDQSRRQFINAILRRESGAAISASEYDNYTRQYFPVPGDSKEVRAQKAQARELKIRGLASEGKRVQSQLQAPSGDPNPGEVRKGYRFKGGNPADKNSWEKA